MDKRRHMVLMARGFGHLQYLGEGEAFKIQKANIKRTAQCVTALESIQNPAAVKNVIGHAALADKLLARMMDPNDNVDTDDLVKTINGIRGALNQLDTPPEAA